MWPRIVNIVLGIWMMIVPYLFGYEKTAAENAYILGAVIASTSVIAMAESVRNVRLLNILFGLWLILAPWILSFDVAATRLNDPVTGILIIAMSLIKGKIREQMGGGWKAIFRDVKF